MFHDRNLRLLYYPSTSMKLFTYSLFDSSSYLFLSAKLLFFRTKHHIVSLEARFSCKLSAAY